MFCQSLRVGGVGPTKGVTLARAAASSAKARRPRAAGRRYPSQGAAARGVAGFIRRGSGTPRGTLKKKKLKTCFASPKFAAHI